MRWIKSTDLTFKRHLAQGSSATVFLGSLDGQEVAIRKPRIRSLESLRRFEWEVSVRRQLCHPRVLPLVAACNEAPNYCTVSPYMQRGTLFEFIHEQNVWLALTEKLQIIIQLVEAVVYLHSKNLVHRDIKSENVLLDTNLNVFISDLDLLMEERKNDVELLSLASEYRPSAGRLKHQVGTLIYLAPEILENKRHSSACDVYSLGVVMNEILTGVIPYVDRRMEIPQVQTILETRFNESKLKRAIVVEGLRPVLASSVEIPFELRELIQRCWSADPSERPCASKLLFNLKDIVGRLDSSCMVYRTPEDGEIIETNSSERTDKNKSTVLLESNLKFCESCYSYSSIGVCAVPGLRGEDRMEDRYCILSPFRSSGEHLLAVFDGHGGDECAQFLKQYFADTLSSFLDKGVTPEDALKCTFQQLDDRFIVSQKSYATGSTALVLYFAPNGVLFVANAGDSLAVLGSSSVAPFILNRQHSIHLCDDEKTRIELKGGTVIPITISNETFYRIEGQVSLTRAFGDSHLKQFLTSEPELTRIDKADWIFYDWIILATDGLWDVLSPEDVTHIMRKTVSKGDLVTKRL
ncbi:protein kinase / protein phosphatase 2C [Galdieria sulphuraria]|uniref:Protein kinase / protein phosphatase 2C n=1 Tax=Galdieria sulphuraria TaxID=130081 RepID=M2W5X2_GALSU|nr:protein kinase / protein phosphatase 2C [Galdieria sulphuraria]EME31171.1 protein kinase / protein phosphatase 2C [Galdieria sulphuraria]|eukprot:XP_005707691.1 protein kinase / protein phosphatase 2C [Galdieria sulphuraria]